MKTWSELRWDTIARKQTKAWFAFDNTLFERCEVALRYLARRAFRG